jgi:hypothetical protein
MMTAPHVSQGTAVDDVSDGTAGWSHPACRQTSAQMALQTDQDHALVDKLYQLYGQSTVRERATATSGKAARWGIALVEAAIGYEWFVSGLNKILNGHFTAGLDSTLRDAMKNNTNGWWVSLTQHLVLPNVNLIGPLVPIGELLLALGFFTGAALWLLRRPAGRWTRFLPLGVIGALLASALMTTNFYLMAGNTLPGLDPANAFNEGLSIDGLLTVIGVGLIAAHASSLRTHRAASSADTSRADGDYLQHAASGADVSLPWGPVHGGGRGYALGTGNGRRCGHRGRVPVRGRRARPRRGQ